MLEDTMNRFYVTFELSALDDSGAADIPLSEALTDATLDALLELPELIDPDAGAELATGRIEFMMMVDASTPEQAVAVVGRRLRECLGLALGRFPGFKVEFRGATAIDESVVPAAS